MKLGIITDIHEDIVSLKMALHVFEKERCDYLACLGDIVGFCNRYQAHIPIRKAGECIDLVSRNCKYVVAGNHDLNAVQRLPEYRGKFSYPGNWFSLSVKERIEMCGQQVWLYDDEMPLTLSAGETEFLGALPEFLVIQSGAESFLLSHFNYPDITGSETAFPRNAADIQGHLDFIRGQGCAFGITGHMHTEGLLISTKGQRNLLSAFLSPYRYFPFGKYEIHPYQHTINVPPVISINKQGGVTIINTSDMECSVIQIR